jgi:hypothetical protein
MGLDMGLTSSLTEEAAEAELREILEDEPEWVNVSRVVPIELVEGRLSAN